MEVAGAEPGMMDWPPRIFSHHIAVVTLIQREHARSDYGLEEIANEKFRLVNALRKDGKAILNINDPLLRERGLLCDKKVIWVGCLRPLVCT
jgi:UDP-N-acetylmuramyl pentapeptide synthase